MIKEALEYLFSKQDEANAIETKELPDNQLLVARTGEESRIVKRDRDGVKYSVCDIESIVSFIKDRATEEATHILIRDVHIQVWTDAENHIVDFAELKISPSAAYKDLMAWESAPRLQRSVVKALRGPLEGTFESSLLKIFKNLDFERMQGARAKVTHSGESLGRSIEQKVQSADGEIPEKLTFSLPLWRHLPVPEVKLAYAVQADCDSMQIDISPIGDTIEDALYQTKVAMRQYLETAFPNILVMIG